MTWLLVAIGGCLLVGTTLLLGEVGWFARRPLTDRLAPYLPGGEDAAGRRSWWSVASWSEVVGPLAREVGASVARAVGITEDVGRRLRRVHAATDATAFRVRQLVWAGAATGAGLLGAIVVGAPLLVGLAIAGVAGVLALLLVEQQLLSASQAWQRAVQLELPVVTEQLAMRLSAGASLTVALDRVAGRGQGAVARDLTRVLARVRQGAAVSQALREWADLADVDAVRRLVGVLELQRDTGDLGRLLAAEARTLRAEQHRELVAIAEKRGQQVWVPVTVAALVPGALFLAVPFTSALRTLFG